MPNTPATDNVKSKPRRNWLPYALLAIGILIAIFILAIVLLTIFSAKHQLSQLNGQKNETTSTNFWTTATSRETTRSQEMTTSRETMTSSTSSGTSTSRKPIPIEAKSKAVPICLPVPRRTKCKAVRQPIKEDEQIPSEIEVSQLGHFSGFRPQHYSLNLTINRDQATSFFGSMSIVLSVETNEASRILIHADAAIVDLDLSEVVISQCESGEEICVSSMVRELDRQLIIIDLAAPLNRGSNVKLEFRSFTGRNSPGLHSQNTDPPAWSQRRSWVVSTIFQMRNARSVFPCIDHPALKAKMSLCVRHPPRSQARANMKAYFSELDEEDARWRRTCFEQTPEMSTYLFAFAVFDRMQSIVDDAKQLEGPEIEVILADQLEKAQFEWVRNETKQVLSTMATITGTEYPLDHLAILTSSLPMYGIENFGLITLNEQWVEYPKYDLAHTILAHEVTHQWIGNLFTINLWEEICLQEGLNTYVEWMIGSNMPTISTPISQRIREKRGEAMRDEVANVSLIRPYSHLAEITTACFKKPPVIFAMIEEAFGRGTINRFVQLMVQNYAYGNVGFEQWIEQISIAANNNAAGQILRQYFTRPGFPLLNIRRSPTGFEITQTLMQKNAPVPDAEPSVIPVTLLDSNNANLKLMLTERRQNIAAPPSSGKTAGWVVADLNSTAYSRVIYEPANYMALMTCHTSGANCPIETVHLQQLAGDLCFGLMTDQLDPSPTTLSQWIAVFSGMVERRLVTGECGCCMNWREGRSPGSCKWTWNDRCEKIRLMQTLVTLHSKKVHRKF